MNKMNKKGFTLIEMLVVIAVIAVLVSIIIPTVTSATDKAAAATNAANLRSWKAELVTDYLANGKTNFTCTWADDATATNSKFTAPAVKDMADLTDGATMVATYDKDNDTFVVTIDSKKIDDFAKFASDGAWS